jgi:hypothetical protein
MDYQDKQLIKDLDRLSKRVNAETGVPMFLACENLAVEELSDPPRAEDRSFNRRFVSAFRTDAEQVGFSRVEAPVAEIARIVELLAERDFALPEKGDHL